jgi:hypothetical protein
MYIYEENFMFKKSLIIGSVTLLLALFALSGCSNPTGSNGPTGRDGTLVLQGAVSADALAEYFETDGVHIIKLGTLTTTTTVAGVIPPGKTLQIAGAVGVPTGAGDRLTINGGTLHILETGALTVAGSGADGALERGDSGALVIEGDLVINPLNPPSFTEDDFMPGWISFGAAGAVDMGTNATADHINGAFEFGVPAIKANITNMLYDLSVYSSWTGGRKLIVYGTQASGNAEPMDLTNKGPLIIGTANKDTTLTTPGVLTLTPNTTQDALIVSRAGGSLTVAQGARLVLPAAAPGASVGWLPDNIPVTIYGKLSSAGVAGTVTAMIPPNVDLSRGTLTAESNAPTFVFSPRVVNIAQIELPFPITIQGTVPASGPSTARQQVILNVGSIVSSAAVALTLPAGTTTVDKIYAGAALTIGSSANGHALDPAETVKTILRPSIIAGALSTTTVTLGNGSRLELNGPIDLSNTLVLDSDNLGTPWAGQLALIVGGTVNTQGDHLAFTGGETLSTELRNSGEVTFSGEVLFNRSAAFAKAIIAGPTVINGRGTFGIAAAGSLLVNDNVTFNIKGFGVDPGVSIAENAASVITIADAKSIYIGTDSQFAVGSNLTLIEGQYLATGIVGIAPVALNTTISVLTSPVAPDNGLTISPANDTVNKITLLSDAAATFTAAKGGGGESVQFGKEGIVLPAGSATSGAILTVSGTAATAVGEVTVSGATAITLGTHSAAAQKGTLRLLNGATLTPADASPAYSFASAYTKVGDFDIGNLLSGTAYNTNLGVDITTKAGTTNAAFTSTTVGRVP